MTASEASTATDRDQFIPVRKTDILDALVEHGPLASEAEREQFRQVCRLLAAIYHYEYFAQLERLRDDYYYFNPEFDPHGRVDEAALKRTYDDLLESLTSVLKGANFVELTHDEIARAHDERSTTRVQVKAPLHDYREVRLFRRGHHTEVIETKEWLGLRKRSIETLVYDDVVLFVAMKPKSAASKRDRKRLVRRRRRPGSVLIKYFRNIVRADLHTLFPEVRVVMSMFDRLFLSGPALLGGIPILLKLATTVTVLFVVVGFYLGVESAVKDEEMKSRVRRHQRPRRARRLHDAAVAALSGAIAEIPEGIDRQHLFPQRQQQCRRIFDYIIGSAEEQECKEAFLAYYFLRTAAMPPKKPELDAHIEHWLQQAFGVDIDFEVDDALAKLDRLGLLKRDGERLSAPPPEEALARLDEVWDNYFRFSNVGSTPVPAQ